MRCLTFKLLVTTAMFGVARFAVADPGDILQFYRNPSPSYDDRFGTSVMAVGGDVLIAVPYENAGAEDSGCAYLFSGSTGAFLRTFERPTAQAQAYFGSSLAAAGNNVLIGAPDDHTGAERAGAVYSFDAATGHLLQSYFNPTPSAWDRFGTSLAAVDNKVLIGSPWVGGGSPGSYGVGEAYLFDRAMGNLLLTISPPMPFPQIAFGSSVAVLGNNLLIGASYDYTSIYRAGIAYLFDGTSGTLLQTYRNPTPKDYDAFGYRVAALGDNVLISAPFDDTAGDNAGAVYLFEGATGALLQTFLGPAPVANFGYSVTAVGDNVLIGAPGQSTVYLFDATSGSLLQTIVDPIGGGDVGKSVSAAGTNLLLGAPNANVGATHAGAAYLIEGYSAEPAEWDNADSGSYNEPLNWTLKTVPIGADVVVTFGESIKTNSTVDVSSPVIVGTITFDNAEESYTIAGPAEMTLQMSSGDAQVNVLHGSHTISAPLSLAGGLTVDTAAETTLRFTHGSPRFVMGGVTKEGLGKWVLDGGILPLGEINVNNGTLQVRSGLLAMSGGDVNIAAGATLKTGGAVNRRVLGEPGSLLETSGATDIGLLAETDGYDFRGTLKVGSNMVGLKDADRAKVYKGATIAGGTLASFNGLELQEGSVAPPANWTISGYGTIAGAVHLVNAVVWGNGPTEMITLPGVVTGKAKLLNNVALTGLSRLGASPAYTPMSGSLSSSEMEVWGGQPFYFDKVLFEGVGGEYSQFGAVGELILSGDLTVKLMGGFVPGPQNQFRMFESLEIHDPEFEMIGSYNGWFSKVTLPTQMQGWFWRFGYADGSSSTQVPTGIYDSATLMIPEPGTLALLITGAFGMLLLVCKRRAERVGRFCRLGAGEGGWPQAGRRR